MKDFVKLCIVVGMILFTKMTHASQDSLSVGQSIPEFSLITPDSTTVFDKESLSGKVVVLDFWATWCAPCKKLTHDLDALLKDYHKKGDFQMIGVDYREYNKSLAVKYWGEAAYPFPMAWDNDVLGKAIQAGNPTLIVLDKEGIVRGRWDAYHEKVAFEVKTLVDQLLH